MLGEDIPIKSNQLAAKMVNMGWFRWNWALQSLSTWRVYQCLVIFVEQKTHIFSNSNWHQHHRPSLSHPSKAGRFGLTFSNKKRQLSTFFIGWFLSCRFSMFFYCLPRLLEKQSSCCIFWTYWIHRLGFLHPLICLRINPEKNSETPEDRSESFHHQGGRGREIWRVGGWLAIWLYSYTTRRNGLDSQVATMLFV